jgi:hypothetical protein
MTKYTERFAHGWTDTRSIFGHATDIDDRKYGAEYKYERKWGAPTMLKKKIDTHIYTSEAKDLDIETCRAMWLVRYGDEWVDTFDLIAQDNLTWEIGNRLFWADALEHATDPDKTNGKYRCKS